VKFGFKALTDHNHVCLTWARIVTPFAAEP
jgi:hypothetical protein